MNVKEEQSQEASDGQDEEERVGEGVAGDSDGSESPWDLESKEGSEEESQRPRRAAADSWERPTVRVRKLEEPPEPSCPIRWQLLSPTGNRNLYYQENRWKSSFWGWSKFRNTTTQVSQLDTKQR